MTVGSARVPGPSSILQTALMASGSPMDPSITNHPEEQEMSFVWYVSFMGTEWKQKRH